MNDVINQVSCKLPVDEGFVVTAMLGSVEEAKSFIMKFVDLTSFIDRGVVRLVAHDEDQVFTDSFYVNDELVEESYIPCPEEVECDVLSINQYFEGEEVQVVKQEVEVYREDQVELTDEITSLDFPVFARVCLYSGFDRTGDVEVREIEFHSMGAYVKHPIQIW